MKKHSMFKILGVVILIVAILSWIIPASQFTGSEMLRTEINRVGILDLFTYPFLSIQFFIQMIVFVLAVGGLYGVLNKTGKYTEMLEKLAKKMKGKETLVLVSIAFIFAVTSSVFGFTLVWFLFIPFVISILLLLGYDKITAFLATFGSILIGVIGSTYNVQVVGYINQVLGTEFTTNIYSKIALLVIAFIIYIYLALRHAKKAIKSSKKENIEDKFLSEKSKSSRKTKIWPLVVIFVILFILFILGGAPWKDMFNIEIFTTLNENVTSFEVFGHTIFGYLIGSFGEFGTWYFNEFSIIAVITSLILKFVYHIKMDEFLEAFAEGVKKVSKSALLMALAMVVVIITAYHPYYTTIVDWLMMLCDKMSGLPAVIFEPIRILFTSVVTMIGSLLNIEVVYFAQSTIPYLSSIFSSADAKALLAVIIQAMYGLTMFVAPTSLVLVLGLEYLDIPYKNWMKFCWKLILTLLVVCIAVFIILALI